MGHRPSVEGGDALRPVDLPPAVAGAAVHAILHAGLHHHAPANGVQWVGDHAGGTGDDLRRRPALPEWRLRRRPGRRQELLGRVEAAKVEPPVDDHPLEGRRQAPVDAPDAFLLVDGAEEVADAAELPGVGGADVGRQAGVGDVERVDDDQRCAAGGGPGGEIGGCAGDQAAVVLGLDRAPQHRPVKILHNVIYA